MRLYLRRSIALLLFALAVPSLASISISASPQNPSASSPATLRVLFVGNSFTFYNDLPRVVAGIGESVPGSPAIEVASAAIGGFTLERHWKNSETRDLLESRTWDVVVLQGQSQMPLRDPQRLEKFARKFDEKISSQGGRTLLFMTWARADTPADVSAIAKAYREIGRELGVDVVPVGEAWSQALTEQPALRLHVDDGLHPNRAGTYLTAHLLFSSITGLTVPEDGASAPESDAASFLRRVANAKALEAKVP